MSPTHIHFLYPKLSNIPQKTKAASYLARLECLSRGDLAGAAAVRSGRIPKSVRDATEAMLADAEDEEALLKEDEVSRAKRWVWVGWLDWY